MSGTLLSTCRKMYKINFWYLTYHEMSATILTYTKLSGIEMSYTWPVAGMAGMVLSPSYPGSSAVAATNNVLARQGRQWARTKKIGVVGVCGACYGSSLKEMVNMFATSEVQEDTAGCAWVPSTTAVATVCSAVWRLKESAQIWAHLDCQYFHCDCLCVRERLKLVGTSTFGASHFGGKMSCDTKIWSCQSLPQLDLHT